MKLNGNLIKLPQNYTTPTIETKGDNSKQASKISFVSNEVSVFCQPGGYLANFYHAGDEDIKRAFEN